MAPDNDPNKAPATTTGDGTPATATPNPQVTELQQKLETESKARLTAERSFNNLRVLNSRQAAELGNARKELDSLGRQDGSGTYDPNDPYATNDGAPAKPVPRAKSPEQINQEADIAMVKFRQDVDDWRDYWEDITKLTSDPATAPIVASYNTEGQLDVYRSLHNAMREVKIKRMEAKQGAAVDAQAKLDNRKAENRRDAVISGDGTTEPVESYTMEQLQKMSYRELVEKRLVPVSEKDPPLQNERAPETK